MRDKARAAGVLTPHILPDGGHLTQRETAIVLHAAGPVAARAARLNTMAPDEGNMYLLGKVGSAGAEGALPARRWSTGRARSAFFMTEPATKAAPAPTRR